MFSMIAAAGDITTIDDYSNKAIVRGIDKTVEIDKFIANSDEKVTISIDTEKEIDTICFQFPVSTHLITINEFKISEFLWDTDINKDAKITENEICYNGLGINSKDLVFKASYKGEGSIKYNITFDDTVLDPYLIGDLSRDGLLGVYLPFNNNIQNYFSSKNNTIVISDSNWSYYDYSAVWFTNLPNIFDNNFDTASTLNYVAGLTSAELFFSHPRNLSHTGAVWQVDAGNSVYGDRERFNLTVPAACFNAYTDRIQFEVILYPSYSYFMCFDGVGYTNLYTKPRLSAPFEWTTSSPFYDSRVYFTTSLNYSVFSNPSINTQYVNDKDLYLAYFFNLYGNDTTGYLNYINPSNLTQRLNNSDVNITNSSMLFDGTRSSLNLSSNYSFINYTLVFKTNSFGNGGATNIIFTNGGGYSYGGCEFGIKNINELTVTCVNNSLATDGAESYESKTFTLTQPIAYGKNHTYAITYNDKNFTLYKDGIYQDSELMFAEINYANASMSFMGRRMYSGSEQWFNGSISYLLLYNRSLSANEILILNNSGNFTYNKIGEANSSIFFNGNEFIAISNISLTDSNRWSTCAFINATSINPSTDTLFSFGTSQYVNILTNKYRLYNYGFASPIIDNTWYHVCTVTNGSYSKYYINGILTNTTANGAAFSRNGRIKVGQYPSGGYGFNGVIDEFTLYTRQLSDNEILTLSRGYEPLTWINISLCTASATNILNYYLYDEQNISLLTPNETSYELAMILTFNNTIINYSIKIDAQNPLKLCLPNETLDYYNFTMNSTIKFTSEGYNTRYDYLLNIPLNYTNKGANYTLYLLPNSESTTFLVTYQNAYYIYQPDVLIDLQKKFISQNNQYISVENAITDNYGQTRLHLQAEDTTYRILVWKNNTLLYQTTDFYGLCLESPCTIALRNPSNESINHYIGNIEYTMSNLSQYHSTKNIKFNYNTIDGTSAKINLVVYNQSGTKLCNSTVTAASGAINCTTATTFTNQTYYAEIYKNDVLIGYSSYTSPLPTSGFENMGILLSAFMYLMLVLMALSNGIMALFMGVIVLVAMGLMMILNTGSVWGTASIIIALIGGTGILVWKFHERGI